MNRRDYLKGLSLGAVAGGLNLFAQTDQRLAEVSARANRGSKKITIAKVRPIMTAPQRARLVVVKVETSEPGLYGLGCATFNQRPLAVVTAVEKYLDPFAHGRDVDDIEDMWQNAYTSSYWRNGPVLNNALSGLDMALWDIKAKRAGMPVYQLLGGKCRFAVDCYAHSSGRDNKELEESVKRNMERGFRHIRLQLGGYGSPHLTQEVDYKDAGFGMPRDTNMDSYPYLKATPKRSSTSEIPAASGWSCCTTCTNGSHRSKR
jgi:mannonate dehydratase